MAAFPLRRFTRFAQIEHYVTLVVLSPWWAEMFPNAPLEVEVHRRSRSATFSAATTTGGEVGLVALVDGRGWGLETVLHELAHLAAGNRAAHGPVFAGALEELWRHEAGVHAWATLHERLVATGLRPSDDRRDDGRPGGSPPRTLRP